MKIVVLNRCFLCLFALSFVNVILCFFTYVNLLSSEFAQKSSPPGAEKKGRYFKIKILEKVFKEIKNL